MFVALFCCGHLVSAMRSTSPNQNGHILTLKVKLGFLVGFEFGLSALQTVENCYFQTLAIDFSSAGQAINNSN